MAFLISQTPTASTIDPTSALSNALKDFELTLNRDQKSQYHATTTKPDASSVISFVARLDETAQERKRTGISSRLVTFLDALQQFTGIIDTFVASNPTIAALVWGGVKTTILAASNVSSFFGKMTSMIMQIGKFCPAYSSFGHLYPDSVELQSALCNYYASVIRLCTKIITVLQRSAVSHALSSIAYPFESEFSDHITQLQEGAELIKLQSVYAANKATLQAEKLAAEERTLNKKLRLSIKKEQSKALEWRLQHSQRETSQLREATRDRLSTLQSLKAYKRVLQQRVSGTAEWIVKDDAFCQWRSDRKSAVLWCSGKMGTGKTVLMSSIVEQLHILKTPTDSIVHHFCFSDHHASLNARDIMGSIARQILDGWLQNASTDQLRAMYREIIDMTSDGITRIISDRLLANQSYHILLDGIDECGIDEAKELVKCLSEIYRKHENIKIALASRSESENLLRQRLNIKYRIKVLEVKTRSDVRCYIDTTLDQRLEDKELVLSQPSIILEICYTLERESQGMFLWVRLFIDDLCEQKSDHDVVAALQSPPPSISRLIDRKIDRIQQRPFSKDVLKLLQFCGVVKRPLTVLEFRELLSIRTAQRSRDVGQMVHDFSEVVADAGGLIYIDEEEQTIHYVHQSVKNYLFDTSTLYSGFNTMQLDLQLGFLLLVYLNFDDFKRSLVKASPKAYTGSNIPFRPIDMAVNAVVGSNSHAWQAAAQKLLRNRINLQQLRGKELERKIFETIGTNQLRNQVELQYSFLEYARSYWLDHQERLDATSDPNTWNLFEKLIKGENGLIDTPWNAQLRAHPSRHLLCQISRSNLDWALSNQKFALVMYELVHNINAIHERDQRRILNVAPRSMIFNLMSMFIRRQKPISRIISTALTIAARNGLIDCVDLYIQQGFDTNKRPEKDHDSALQAAAEGGHLNMIERLLIAKADVNAAPAEPNGRTALQAAAERGHLNIVERLLITEADVNAAASSHGYTALQAAAAGGYLEVVEILLTANADVNSAATGFYGYTALQAAAKGGHLEVVERLLTAKADVNAAATHYGYTALQAAAAGGHLEVVETLLTAEADVNAAAGWGGYTALQAAAAGGYLKVVERLLSTKAEVNTAATAVGSHGYTALQAAAAGGYLEVVEILLTANADVNTAATGLYRYTALQSAAAGGYLKVVERLLAIKADVNAAASPYGYTALQAAAGGGHLKVVETLLATKADVNAAAGSGGYTALQAAARGSHLEVVETLLTAKANVNAAPAEPNGYTALQAAAERGHLNMVERLLVTKADINAATSSRGYTALQAAARGGYLEVVEALLTTKANVNAAATEFHGLTALQAAAIGGHLEVVETLLNAEADVNAPAAVSGGYTALQAAAGGGHLEVVETLLIVKADVNAAAAVSHGYTALQAAARGGYLQVVETLLNADADVNAAAAAYGGYTALQAAAIGGHLEVVETLLNAEADVNVAAAASGGYTALQAAAGEGDLRVVEILLNAKADVNAAATDFGGCTALQAAARGGHLRVVERLLIAKADVNAIATRPDKYTALQAAAAGGYLKVVERLLIAKADVNPATERYTALQAAAAGGHLKVVETLLAAEADVNAPATEFNGRTALQAAAAGGHSNIVETLIAAKADVNAAAASLHGRTALQAAAEGGHLKIVEILLAANADVNAAAATESGGRTAIRAAVAQGHSKIVERLRPFVAYSISK